jgi:hypothetical protein
MKRYILFTICSSLVFFDSDFDTQKAAKDYMCADIDSRYMNFVLYDKKYDTIQYIKVLSEGLHCTQWSHFDAKEFVKFNGINI